MTSLEPVTTPSVGIQILAGVLRHLLTTAATALVGLGALQSNQTASFVTIGVGLVTWLVPMAWSVIQKRRTAAGK